MIWWLRHFTVYSPRFLKAWLILPNLWYHWRRELRWFGWFFPLTRCSSVPGPCGTGVCPLPLPASLPIALTLLVCFPIFWGVLGPSLNVRSEFKKMFNRHLLVTGKWLIHLLLRGAAESITSLMLQCLLLRDEQPHTRSCRQYLCVCLPLVCTSQSLYWAACRCLAWYIPGYWSPTRGSSGSTWATRYRAAYLTVQDVCACCFPFLVP